MLMLIRMENGSRPHAVMIMVGEQNAQLISPICAHKRINVLEARTTAAAVATVVTVADIVFVMGKDLT